MEYKVRHLINDIWGVILITQVNMEFEEEKVYQGGLADCEAYIRLKKGGYM